MYYIIDINLFDSNHWIFFYFSTDPQHSFVVPGPPFKKPCFMGFKQECKLLWLRHKTLYFILFSVYGLSLSCWHTHHFPLVLPKIGKLLCKLCSQTRKRNSYFVNAIQIRKWCALSKNLNTTYKIVIFRLPNPMQALLMWQERTVTCLYSWKTWREWTQARPHPAVSLYDLLVKFV